MGLGISHTGLPRLSGGLYHDLDTALVSWHALGPHMPDGIELVILPEWNPYHPPLTPTDAKWEQCPRYSSNDLAAWVKENSLQVLSVHANRDIGVCLCSADPRAVARGQELLAQALALCHSIGTSICVAHVWDTWSEQFNPENLARAVGEVTARWPQILLAAEYLPVSLPGLCPQDILQHFPHRTWDTHWAGLYRQALPADLSPVAHFHLQGEVAEIQLDPVKAALSRGYNGHVILEPRGRASLTQTAALLQRLAAIC